MALTLFGTSGTRSMIKGDVVVRLLNGTGKNISFRPVTKEIFLNLETLVFQRKVKTNKKRHHEDKTIQNII